MYIKRKCATLKNESHGTEVPKDYWDKKNLQDMGPLSVNSIHITQWARNGFEFFEE